MIIPPHRALGLREDRAKVLFGESKSR